LAQQFHVFFIGIVAVGTHHCKNKIRNQYKNGETIYLNEEWSGYEDNYFDITVTRLETDEECKARIELEEKEALREKQRLQRAKEAAECKKRREIENKIKELQKQL
jgi:hypothetical protein